MLNAIFRLIPCFLWIFFITDIACADSPNIVLILADDLGFSDTAPYGSEIQTPNISKLADEGIRFTNYHTAATCAPTRGMLLTGVDSHRNGVPNMPEALPPVQAEHDNYKGTLNHNVVTIASLLKDAGYHTYITGKWHLGRAPDLLPSQRGFERTFTLADTGADNWENKTYLPIYEKPHWFADGKETDLPPGFYSSKFFIDKTIEFIESNRKDEKPFFAYIPFQAVHIPVQAPRGYTDKYMGVYDEGWHKLRENRLEKAKMLKLVPGDTKMVNLSTTVDWNSLSDEQKRYESKKMAVYAGMVAAMDHHIGRLIHYLKETDQYDNTVFIFASDNGPEPSDAFSRSIVETAYVKLWMQSNGYSLDYEPLGARGSYVNMGPSFASAAATPLSYYKFYSGEGGMRVPMIISGSKIAEKGSTSNAFTFVTDIAPTILEISGVPRPQGSYHGREVELISGKSLLPLANGEVERIHGDDEAIGYELGGNAALFKGDYKIVKNRGPIGDDKWHLFNIITDPGETKDLREEMPVRFSAMMEAFQTYTANNNVLPVPDGYDQSREITYYAIRNRLGPNYRLIITGGGVVIVTGILILPGFLLWRRFRSKRL